MNKCKYDLSKDYHNKDCLNCVLDKIRAEIEQIAKDYDKFANYRCVRGLSTSTREKVRKKYEAGKRSGAKRSDEEGQQTYNCS